MMRYKRKFFTVLCILIILVISFFIVYNPSKVHDDKADLKMVFNEEYEITDEEKSLKLNEEVCDEIIQNNSSENVDELPQNTYTENINESTIQEKMSEISDETKKDSSNPDNEPQNIKETKLQKKTLGINDKPHIQNDLAGVDDKLESDFSAKENHKSMPQKYSAKIADVHEASSIQNDENNNIDTLFCTLSVNCTSVIENREKLKENKKEIIPENGIVLEETIVEFSNGESAFDVLCREMKNNKIQIDFVSTPMYNSIYIKGIANLYEFDCGELSGWMYKVNGEKPTFGCSQYKLKDKDKIEFFYTCNMFE